MSGVQIGKTETGNNWIGYVIDQAPGPMLIVQPTVETAKRFSKQRLAHVIADTLCLRGKVAESRERDSGNTILSKEFFGGVLFITGANSAVGLRSMPARYMFFDEVDGYPGDVDGEGDPVEIAEKRSATFRRRKILKTSTPKEEGLSRIAPTFARTDRRYYFVPCPLCGYFQVLQFEHLRYQPKDEPTYAWYECLNCHEAIDERWKTQMLAGGRWIPTATNPELVDTAIPAGDVDTLGIPPVERAAGYHLSALYSPVGWMSWLTIANQWMQAQRDVRLLKVFVNTILGEPWQERGEAPDWEKVYLRREEWEAGAVPINGVFLTAGADVQIDRIEVEIVAWGANRQSWSIAYEVLDGDTATPEPWRKLGALLESNWPHASGRILPIMALAVDTGFRANMAYEFALRYPQLAHGPAGSRIYAPRTVVPVKGDANPFNLISHVTSADAARRRHGLKIVTVGTPVAKQELYDQLRKAPLDDGGFPPGYCHFPSTYSKTYFQGLCSENRVIRTVGGKPRVDWVRDPNIRNETLDCRTYARAAAALFGMDRFTERDWQYLAGQTPAPVQAERKSERTEERDSAWLERRTDWLS